MAARGRENVWIFGTRESSMEETRGLVIRALSLRSFALFQHVSPPVFRPVLSVKKKLSTGVLVFSSFLDLVLSRERLELIEYLAYF